MWTSKRVLAWALSGVWLGSLAGCASVNGPSKPVPLGKPFELKSGEAATVADELLVIRFESVTADSRCPVGVVCVWAGDASVGVRATRLPATTASLTLHTDGALGSESSFQDYVIRLVELTPRPRASETIPPRDYVATLVVTRP